MKQNCSKPQHSTPFNYKLTSFQIYSKRLNIFPQLQNPFSKRQKTKKIKIAFGNNMDEPGRNYAKWHQYFSPMWKINRANTPRETLDCAKRMVETSGERFREGSEENREGGLSKFDRWWLDFWWCVDRCQYVKLYISKIQCPEPLLPNKHTWHSFQMLCKMDYIIDTRVYQG